MNVSFQLDNCLAEQIVELGFGITSSREECEANLRKLGVGEMVTPRAIAKVLSMMIRSHSSVGEQVSLQSLRNTSSLWSEKEKGDGSQGLSWNIENFVFALAEVVSFSLSLSLFLFVGNGFSSFFRQAPSLSWNDVVVELDHPEFMVKDRAGLILLISALRLGLRMQHCSVFPIEQFYKFWANSDGQVSSSFDRWLAHSFIHLFILTISSSCNISSYTCSNKYSRIPTCSVSPITITAQSSWISSNLHPIPKTEKFLRGRFIIVNLVSVI
jgi:hypothetical protein